jgi:hypothetical protein
MSGGCICNRSDSNTPRTSPRPAEERETRDDVVKTEAKLFEKEARSASCLG